MLSSLRELKEEVINNRIDLNKNPDTDDRVGQTCVRSTSSAYKRALVRSTKYEVRSTKSAQPYVSSQLRKL